jgi:limonene-1,2-epoxide hydrolase
MEAVHAQKQNPLLSDLQTTTDVTIRRHRRRSLFQINIIVLAAARVLLVCERLDKHLVVFLFVNARVMFIQIATTR